MRSRPGKTPASSHSVVPVRHAGWAVMIGVLGIALIMIGGMLVAMLQAPVVRPPVIVTGVVLIAAGLALLPVAWLGRRHRGPD